MLVRKATGRCHEAQVAAPLPHRTGWLSKLTGQSVPFPGSPDAYLSRAKARFPGPSRAPPRIETIDTTGARLRRVNISGSSCKSSWGREANLLSLRALRGKHKSLKFTEKLLILIYTIYRTFTESLVSKVSAWLTQKKTEGHPACVNWLTAHAGTFNSARQALRGGEKHFRVLQSAANPFWNPLSPKSSKQHLLDQPRS